jgi:hypothetical protein
MNYGPVILLQTNMHEHAPCINDFDSAFAFAQIQQKQWQQKGDFLFSSG